MKKKLDLQQLMSVSGGTPDEFYAYLDQLAEKYGLAPGDIKAVSEVMTEEDWDHAGDLFWNGIDFSDFPGL